MPLVCQALRASSLSGGWWGEMKRKPALRLQRSTSPSPSPEAFAAALRVG
jgi:hypothetical protein